MNTPASLDQDQAPATDIADIERFFSEMTPAHLARLGEVYSADAWFKDPFNEVQGLDAVRGIFQHMYDSLNLPRFIVTTRVVQGRQCFLTWDFVFGLRGQSTEITVRGASHLWLAPGTDGRWRITCHRDYWDVAEELYEKLPLLGALMRWLKRRVNAPPR
jgi:ketosteroid isomerase-like protein